VSAPQARTRCIASDSMSCAARSARIQTGSSASFSKRPHWPCHRRLPVPRRGFLPAQLPMLFRSEEMPLEVRISAAGGGRLSSSRKRSRQRFAQFPYERKARAAACGLTDLVRKPHLPWVEELGLMREPEQSAVVGERFDADLIAKAVVQCIDQIERRVSAAEVKHQRRRGILSMSS